MGAEVLVKGDLLMNTKKAAVSLKPAQQTELYLPVG
jgi:hypothetical protein